MTIGSTAYRRAFGILGRGVAGGVCVLIVVLLALSVRHRDPATWLWLVDLRGMPVPLAAGVLVLAAVGLGVAAWAPACGRRCRGWLIVATIPLAMALAANTVQYYELRSQGDVHVLPWVPMTAGTFVAVVGGVLGSVPRLRCAASTRSEAQSRRRHGGERLMIGAVSCAVLGLFPLAQMALLGRSDYRRPADAIVVFGARTYADGRLSDALRDRMATAVALYRQGYADRLVVSGGPGDGDVHETAAMRRYAIDAGVPADAIEVDPAGLNTAATVANTRVVFRDLNVQRVLAVSHAYHLPRVKLSYRAAGLDVFTVPARETYPLTKMPYLMAREVAAWWAYLVQGL